MRMFTSKVAKRLEEILRKTDAPNESFNPIELHGFFFGLAITPDPVMPSQWLPVVFGGDGPMFDDEKDAKQSLGYLMDIYNRFMSASMNQTLRFPFDYKIMSRDLFPDLEDWAFGLFKALSLRPHHWGMTEEYEDMADEDIPDDIKNVIDACTVLTVIALPGECKMGFDPAPGGEPKTEEEIRDAIYKLLPASVEILRRHGAMLHRQMHSGRMESAFGDPVRREPKVGRNDPCPCGSGRKYKRCCGAN